MKAKINTGNQRGSITFFREATDPKFYGMKHARGECRLFRYLAKWLNTLGFDLIRVKAQKDGNMLGDEYQPILRCRKRGNRKAPNVAIYSGFYAIEGAHTPWNAGKVTLLMELDYLDNRRLAARPALVGVVNEGNLTLETYED